MAGGMSKIAVVTGAGSGIGRASAIALAHGAPRSCWRRREPLESAAAAAGDGAVALPADVREPGSVAGLFSEVEERFGRLDVLFNNAGVSAKPVPLEELDAEQWRAVIETNLTGVFLCTQQAFRIMKRQTPRGGRIINNGSISAYTPRPLSAPYTAAKHGVRGLTRQIVARRAAVRHRVRADRHRQRIDGAHRADRTTGVLQADGETPSEPTMDVDHVARAVVYMATLPLDTNVQSMTVMATRMPYVGRG